MSDIDKTIKAIRPSLRFAAPQTYWFSICFGLFNITIGYALFVRVIAVHLILLGLIPIMAWGVVFIIHGIAMLGSLVINDWKITRNLHFIGIAIKTAWWLELVAGTAYGNSPAFLIIWSLLLALQFIVWLYFTPRMSRVK